MTVLGSYHAEQAYVIKRGTPLTFEYEQSGALVRRRGTFRTVLDFLLTHKVLATLPRIPPSFRLFVRGCPILYDYSLWLDSFQNMAEGRMKRCTVYVSSAGSYKAKGVRDG